MEILDRKSGIIVSFFIGIDETLNTITQALQKRSPHLNGEKFLTGKEVCKILHISLRTLQEWRNSEIIPCIKLKGEILYRQSDIDKVLSERSTAIH
jgi:hypothetical protein